MCVHRYDEIRTMQVNYLVSVWLSGGEKESKELHKKLDEKIDSYATGELEHAAEAISSIWDSACKDEALPSVPKDYGDSQSLSVLGSTSLAPSLETSLVKSMREGSLLHRKYWARRSRGGRMGLVYLPTTVSGPTLSQVDKCKWDCVWVTSILSRTVLEYCDGADDRSEEEEEYPEDSDCESECEGDGDSVSGDANAGCERGNEFLPVLKIGSLIA